MIQVGIIGGAGYTAGELIRLLLNHSETNINFVYSTSNAGNKISKVHQDLIGSTELEFSSIIDNLLKGASGQAIQNMNLMFGFPETEGLQLKANFF